MAIFDLQHPWVFTFGIIGNLISLLVYLAPLPTFIQICRKKSTMGFQSLPYVVALFSAMLWMYYAFLKKDALLLISINSFGCVIETIYIVIYLVYASKETRKHTVKLFAYLNLVFFSAVFLLTLFLLKGPNRLVVVGWICVAISVSVFAAPLSIVFQVVRTHSVEFMPFTLSFFLTLSAVIWFTYGLLLKDLCVAVPNVVGFLLGMIQMLLYGVYRNREKIVKDNKKIPEHVINIVMVGGASEIYPVDSQTSSGSDNDNDDDKKQEQIDDKNEKSVAPTTAYEPSQINVQPHSPVFLMCAA